jgi:hypothetical protein
MNQSEDTRLKLEMELEEKRIREEHERALSEIDEERARLEEEAEILREEEKRRLDEAMRMRDELRGELTKEQFAHVKANVDDSTAAIKRKATVNMHEIKKQRTKDNEQAKLEAMEESIGNAMAAQESINEMNTIGRMEQEVNAAS